jgi:cyanophycinase-like exopeptidase
VTGLVPNPAIAPLGNPETAKVTGELKLIMDETTAVVVPEDPWTTVIVDGETEIVKSPTSRMPNCEALTADSQKRARHREMRNIVPCLDLFVKAERGLSFDGGSYFFITFE